MTLDQVREHFEREAFDYDGLIARLIPHYYEQNRLKISPPQSKNRPSGWRKP